MEIIARDGNSLKDSDGNVIRINRQNADYTSQGIQSRTLIQR